VEKRVLCSERLRRVPRQFSWVDQRLIRERYLERCSAAAWGLYLFLVLVGDSQGLSYYSSESICRQLSITPVDLRRLQDELETAGVIVYRRPLYQVLALLPESLNCHRKRSEPVLMAEVLRRMGRQP
jgi:hypothetical protein